MTANSKASNSKTSNSEHSKTASKKGPRDCDCKTILSHTTGLVQNMELSFLANMCSPALQQCYSTLAQHYFETVDPKDYDLCDKQAAKFVESLGMSKVRDRRAKEARSHPIVRSDKETSEARSHSILVASLLAALRETSRFARSSP